MKLSHLTLRPFLIAWLGTLLLSSELFSLETPSSDGPVAMLDTPVLRIPFMKQSPDIDGVLSEGEWQDASALSNFWIWNDSDIPYPIYQYQAPHQLQSQVYAGYDKEHLYLLYRIKVYPDKSWLKALGRFPDVVHHPLYGIKKDDHFEFEIRPYHDNRKGYGMGMFKFFVNPIGTMGDQHWSLEDGEGQRWQSQAVVKTHIGEKWWNGEMKIPLKSLKSGKYASKDADGKDVLQLPPPDGTSYRVWFKNGIGGAGKYTIVNDQHNWNICKTRLILDSQSVGFQINSMGKLMEDNVDIKLTLKNHSAKSQSVRLGFFIENDAGNVYSTYQEATANKGIVELLPGEVKKLHLKKRLVGISGDDNYLWFDVRSAGQPAKILHQNRLAKFHSDNPPVPLDDWREEHLDPVVQMRPTRKDFDYRFQYSPYTNHLSAVVDKGIHGASEEAMRAAKAKLQLIVDNDEEEEVGSWEKTFKHDFATFEIQDLPELQNGLSYKTILLLFDRDERIVGEHISGSFYKGKFKFEKNPLGREDIVWPPYRPIAVKEQSLDFLKHEITLAPSGLPAQIHVKADINELPLEFRKNPQAYTTKLQEIGRGDQLRSPMRFEAVIDGQRLSAKVVEPFKIVKKWKSEIEVASKLEIGALKLSLKTRYDCDGSFHSELDYMSAEKIEIEAFEMIMEVLGEVDHAIAGGWHMQPSSGMEMTLPREEGIVWDSAKHTDMEPLALYYSKFVPWMHFGSGDRAFTWISDSDQGWLIDRNGSTMTLERDKKLDLSMRVKFANHKQSFQGRRHISFQMIPHPQKDKEKGHRRYKWLDWFPHNYAANGLRALPNDNICGIDGSDKTFEDFKKFYPTGAPRLYILKNNINTGTPPIAKGSYAGEWMLNSGARISQTQRSGTGGYGQDWSRPGSPLLMYWGSKSWEDYFVYHCERMVRIGRVPGWWWDELWPPVGGHCVANGMAYFRKPDQVGKGELPYQSNFGTFNARRMLKRIARIQTKNGVPVRSSFWAGTSAITFESYGDSSNLTESAAGFSLSYDIDNITRYPMSFFRLAAGTSRGHSVMILPYHNKDKGFGLMPGDELRYDRAVLGRCLLNDIGTQNSLSNAEQLFGVINILHDFGIFDEEQTEFIPYWRSGKHLRFGEAYDPEGHFETAEENPYKGTYTSVYRRPYKTHNGKTGYKVLMIIHNERDNDVRGRLHINDEQQLLGGKNNIYGMDLFSLKEYDIPKCTFNGFTVPYSRFSGVIDLERRGVVTRATKERNRAVKDSIYGHVHIPAHDYKILYARHDPERGDRMPRDTVWTKKKLSVHKTLKDIQSKKDWWNNWMQETAKLSQPEKKGGF